jgi:cyclopropane fatty-acyl-phospholipid synthase-like methyltransferase
MKRLLRAPLSLYRTWKYRENPWDRPDISIQNIVGGEGEWDQVAMLALSFLKEAGLQPHHTLLDAGCGPFRVGRRLIGYLDPECYTGFDGSQRLLTQGRRLVLEKECDLERKRPRIEYLLIDDESVPLFERFQQRFDFILFHGIFEVISPARVEAALRSIASVMHPHTKVYATFFLNPFGESWTAPIRRPAHGRREKMIVTYPDRAWWHHTPEFFQRVCEAIGTIRYVTYHDYHYPVEGMKMAEFHSSRV